MATWIKLTDKSNVATFVNLEMATQFTHDIIHKRIDIYLNYFSQQVYEKTNADAYAKVLEYLAQIEQQIK
jgi:hypothetical protein